MKENSRLERQKQVNFAVGMAAIDGGKPSNFTRNFLHLYESGQISSSELKKVIINKYTKVSQ